MAVYSRGMTASFIKKIQQALRDAGFDPGPIDGIFGPRTESAVLQYQRDKGLDANGLVDTDMQSMLGLTAAGEGQADPGDYTDDEDTRFNGLAGKPEIWRDSKTGKAYVVYYVPDTEPPIPMMYSVASQEDLQTFFGDAPIKFDKTLTTEDIASTGAVTWGSTDVLPQLGGNPWAGFVERMERAKETQPWLEDPEVFAVYASAYLEGREVERWELEGTDWWQTHNEAQRNWLWAVARDPEEAERIKEDNYIAVFSKFRDLGYTEPPAQLVDYMAMQASRGDWSAAYLQEQIVALTGGESSQPLDADLATFMTNNQYSLGESAFKDPDVRNLFATWLGPVFSPSDAQVSEWAGKLRHGGQAAQDELEDYLRRTRLALFPQYENENLTYEDIASPWRSFATNVWGQRMDETSDTFQEIIRLNDSAEAGKLLRQEGLKQGIGKVKQDALSGLLQSVGGMVRRPL